MEGVVAALGMVAGFCAASLLGGRVAWLDQGALLNGLCGVLGGGLGSLVPLLWGHAGEISAGAGFGLALFCALIGGVVILLTVVLLRDLLVK